MSDTIHAVGYRRLPEGTRRRRPIWAIARTIIALALRRRSTKIALVMCLSVLVGHGVWLAVQLLTQRFASVMATGPFALKDAVGSVEEVISSYLQVQFYFTTPTIAVVAGGAVAEDRRVGAFELYFARPLTRVDYCFGKLLGAAAVPFLTLIVATMTLWITAIGIAPDHVSGDLWHIALPALAGATLGTALLTTTLVGLSAVSNRARNVGIAYVTLVLVIAGVAEGLVEGGYHWGGYLSMERNLRTAVDAMLQLGSPSMTGAIMPSRVRVNADIFGSFVALGAFIAAGLGALWAGLRREVAS